MGVGGGWLGWAAGSATGGGWPQLCGDAGHRMLKC
jgi:hypothetical protein